MGVALPPTHPCAPGLDIHELADAGHITAAQYDAAMRYRALWKAYTQPWLFNATIPWGTNATLTEPQHHLARRFKEAHRRLYKPDGGHVQLLGRVALHDVPCGPECLPWVVAGLDELAAHFAEAT